MDLNDYKNDGWGISVLGFQHLYELIINNTNEKLRVLEFGSGTSTRFFNDIVKNKIKNLEITSFDNDQTFSYKKENNEDYLTINLRELEECGILEYNTQFSNKNYDGKLMHPKLTPITATQKNNFYKLSDSDLSGIYDIIVIDGPHGNGRNFAFLHCKGHVKPNTVIFIDDYNHYDFLEKCNDIFNVNLIYKHTQIGDNFAIVKII